MAKVLLKELEPFHPLFVEEPVLAEQAPMRERAVEFIERPDLVRSIIAEGCDRARDVARETMDDVRQAMGLAFR